LGPFLTHGEYLAWKEKVRLEGAFSGRGSCAKREDGCEMKSIPSLDVGQCSGCESCVEVCPQVFRRNSQTGLIEVVEVEDYPEEEVREAIKLCPADCITLE
jgi:ferredoxin